MELEFGELIINNVKNEKIELYQEDGKYYLRLDFDYEDNNGFYKGHIERIRFDFRLRSISTTGYGYGNGYDDWLKNKKVSVDLGLENLPVELDQNDAFFTLTKVKDKIHKMTVEEIEKKLGYKVEIVANYK